MAGVIPKAETSEVKPHSEKFEFDYEVYADISVSAILSEIRLIGSEYSVKPEIFRVLEDLGNMAHDFSGVCKALDFIEEEGVAIGQYSWTASIKYGRKKVLKLSTNYLVTYEGLEGKDGDHVAVFFNKVVRFATYPYFRALFSHHTAETGIMMPPLPSLNERVD
ncbi:hypothetical protein [Celeribacter ethanolicus]|uniref:hypothetical protein n=1 Tax=Celeribacter ethanolicus TaxID=1758178 RepID=UPI000831BDCF|nr:hypothetical protein [Celeribacter ethanolicus]